MIEEEKGQGKTQVTNIRNEQEEHHYKPYICEQVNYGILWTNLSQYIWQMRNKMGKFFEKYKLPMLTQDKKRKSK